MAIFVIIPQPGSNSGKVSDAVLREFPAAHYNLGNGTWFIYGPSTAQEASEKLGVFPGTDSGPAIVAEIASYPGRANPAVWTWIKNNWETKAVG